MGDEVNVLANLCTACCWTSQHKLSIVSRKRLTVWQLVTGLCLSAPLRRAGELGSFEAQAPSARMQSNHKLSSWHKAVQLYWEQSLETKRLCESRDPSAGSTHEMFRGSVAEWEKKNQRGEVLHNVGRGEVQEGAVWPGWCPCKFTTRCMKRRGFGVPRALAMRPVLCWFVCHRMSMNHIDTNDELVSRNMARAAGIGTCETTAS